MIHKIRDSKIANTHHTCKVFLYRFDMGRDGVNFYLSANSGDWWWFPRAWWERVSEATSSFSRTSTGIAYGVFYGRGGELWKHLCCVFPPLGIKERAEVVKLEMDKWEFQLCLCGGFICCKFFDTLPLKSGICFSPHWMWTRFSDLLWLRWCCTWPNGLVPFGCHVMRTVKQPVERPTWGEIETSHQRTTSANLPAMCASHPGNRCSSRSQAFRWPQSQLTTQLKPHEKS